MPRPTRPYRYRKQMGGLLDFHGFREQTETFLNDIDGDISAANAKIGNLSSLTTTDKSNLVAAINEAAQSGGGGGGEEQFQKVYETTLESPSEGDELTITTADIGGTFVDVMVFAAIPGASNTDTLFVDYLSSSDEYIGSGSVSLEENGLTYAHIALVSFGGLALHLQDGFQSNSKKSESSIAFPPNHIAEYPTQRIAGIASIILNVDGSGATHVFPAGTTIMVYARRKVTA